MTYVMSDLFGNYRKFKEMLSKISFREEDILYILGNTVDYGEEPMELISDLSVRLNVYPIAGEHDYLAARMLAGFEKILESGASPDAGYISEMTAWVQNGGQPTLEGFRALDGEAREGILEYLEEMTLFEEVDVKGESYLLLHAGIADYDPDTDLEDYRPEDFFTVSPDPARRTVEDRVLVVGHKKTESGRIEYGKGSIFINCGVKDGGALACLCLESGEEFYV
ncbi:MAG: hypothetical protein E7643_07195 [Ruminococcaceae bacterium]|nr:hypothetical protein [Oscillospiraceae bacterium]